MSDETVEKIFIGKQEIPQYLSACFYGFANSDTIQVVGRGNHIKRCADIGAIMIREHMDVPDKFPSLQQVLDCLDSNDIEKAKEFIKQLMKCEISIGSEWFVDRFVSTMEITLRGGKK